MTLLCPACGARLVRVNWATKDAHTDLWWECPNKYGHPRQVVMAPATGEPDEALATRAET